MPTQLVADDDLRPAHAKLAQRFTDDLQREASTVFSRRIQHHRRRAVPEHLRDQSKFRCIRHDIVKVPETTRPEDDRGNKQAGSAKGSVVYVQWK